MQETIFKHLFSHKNIPETIYLNSESELYLDKEVDSIKSANVTHRINAKTFELLEKHPEGLSWSELLSKIKASDSNFHPKTVNGCIWKLVERFPDKVYKPSKGLFRLLKYKS
jgi:hypothetical protein